MKNNEKQTLELEMELLPEQGGNLIEMTDELLEGFGGGDVPQKPSCTYVSCN